LNRVILFALGISIIAAALFGSLAFSQNAFAGIDTSNKGQEKITICHVDQETGEEKTITIGAPSVPKHLANHEGDHEGECNDEPEPVCGDGTVNQSSEQCDDGNTTPGDGCDEQCMNEPEPVCGDGTVNQSSEQCDDGNTTPGDGCSEICEIEVSTPTCVSNDQCQFPDLEICAKPIGADPSSEGVCEPRFGACIILDDPVCGVNGVTYDNACVANMNGVNLDYTGVCTEEPSTCTECSVIFNSEINNCDFLDFECRLLVHQEYANCTLTCEGSFNDIPQSCWNDNADLYSTCLDSASTLGDLTTCQVIDWSVAVNNCAGL